MIPRENWNIANEIASSWQAENSDAQAEIVPEGGSVDDSVAGLATLPLDILYNENQLGLTFSNILIDSGTGLTAASLIAAYGFLKKESHIHVLLAASTPEIFRETLAQVKEALENITGTLITHMPHYSFHTPITAQSFGSTNTMIFQTIFDTAQKEGFLLDPIYSSKLYLLLIKASANTIS